MSAPLNRRLDDDYKKYQDDFKTEWIHAMVWIQKQAGFKQMI